MPKSGGLRADDHDLPQRGELQSNGDVVIDPESAMWLGLIERKPSGELAGRALKAWRVQTRRELGLDVERSIIATGHQTLLWHPGILAKYLVTEAFARSHNLATANLVVDQHAEGFGSFHMPIRRADESLAVRTVELCRPAPRPEVPMGRHEAFVPRPLPEHLSGVIPSVTEGARRIYEAVDAHRGAQNAALQMAGALADLMQRWVRPMVNVTATHLIGTSLAAAMMRLMTADPERCAQSYNRAVQAVPEAGIGPLMIRADYVELPLWRMDKDGRRRHAYDGDVEQALSDQQSAANGSRSKIQNPESRIDLLPRALFMTALVRLGMCDLFVHGTGAAVYDRAMEIWIKDWLGVDVGSKAVVTATLHLPLLPQDARAPSLTDAVHAARKAWHDPETTNGSRGPGAVKQDLINEVERQPRRSAARKSAYFSMHEQLERLRRMHESRVQSATQTADIARRCAHDTAIASRRDWPFPLYPQEMIDALAQTAQESVSP